MTHEDKIFPQKNLTKNSPCLFALTMYEYFYILLYAYGNFNNQHKIDLFLIPDPY